MSRAAYRFAFTAHAGQKYGERPYIEHLAAVVSVLRDFGLRGSIEEAGWLHDVLEDTDVTLLQLQDSFGAEVAGLVEAVTGRGSTREARNAVIYAKLKVHPRAAVVKLADRIANVEASPEGSRHLATYREEQSGFEAAVKPLVPAVMWTRLERAIRQGGRSRA